MRPAHQPHEQLRTEAPSQKDHTDKYVSTFVSGSNTVDMSFSNPVLPKSSDYFKVGIDELTLNLNNLSLLESVEGEVLFRILRRGYLTRTPRGMRHLPITNCRTVPRRTWSNGGTLSSLR